MCRFDEFVFSLFLFSRPCDVFLWYALPLPSPPALCALVVGLPYSRPALRRVLTYVLRLDPYTSTYHVCFCDDSSMVRSSFVLFV